jgi:hypothetical protein
MSHAVSVDEIYRHHLLLQLWQLLAMQERQLSRLIRTGNRFMIDAAERLRNKTVNLIQRLVAEDTEVARSQGDYGDHKPKPS